MLKYSDNLMVDSGTIIAYILLAEILCMLFESYARA